VVPPKFLAIATIEPRVPATRILAHTIVLVSVR
jgi:hypothetical protein